MKTPRRLLPLLEEGLIDDVHSQLMSGKEAACYVVSVGGERRVAKVYKEAQERAFQNRATYLEARNYRNSRDRRAIRKGTNYGKKQIEKAWQSAEVDALFRMHASGVRVPTPYVFSEGVLIMDLIDDGEGGVAPRLGEMRFDRRQAVEVHTELMRQCATMLLGGLVHADLSEFNVLMPPAGPTIIDFPQAIDAAANRSARRIFLRDTDNLTRYLSHFAGELKGRRFGAYLWKLYERGELTPEVELEQAPAREPEQAPQPRSRRRAIVEITQEAGDRRAKGGGRRNNRPRPAGDGSRRDGKPANGRRRGGESQTTRAPQGDGVGGSEGQGGGARKRRRRRRRRRGGGAPAA